MSTTHNASSTGLASNIAGALCYLLGPITGLIFLLVEKEDRFVRFHAAHSIVVWASLIAAVIVFTIFTTVLGILPIIGAIIGAILGLLFSLVFGLASFVLWIFLMFQAFNGREWEAPIVGHYARRILVTPSAS